MTIPASYSSAAVVSDMTAAAAAGGGTDYKALVCLFFFGGNDAHNTVMPLRGANRQAYDLYRSDTTNIGIPVDQAPANGLTADWRLHHSLASLKTRWDEGKLGVLLNVGMLQEPTTKAGYLGGTAKLPEQLFSHSDQTPQWQSLPTYKGAMAEGWFGRAADLAKTYYNPAPTDGLSMLYSIYGQQLQVTGFDAMQNSMSGTGALTVNAGTTHSSTLVSGSHLINARTRSEYGNLPQGLWASRVGRAVATQAALGARLLALPGTPAGRFSAVSSNTLAQQFRTVAQTIYSQSALGQRRQLFFVGLGGFDTHQNNRVTHDSRMVTVNDALDAFYTALGDLGMTNNVVTFTESDFGRALLQNGSGVDHGWGGHHFILGGAVNGGLYGTPPDLTADSPDDAGQGRLIPTTSVDRYAGTLLKWWGIPESRLDLVIPNIVNFSGRTIPGLLP